MECSAEIKKPVMLRVVPRQVINEIGNYTHPSMWSEDQKLALQRYLIAAKNGDREAREKAENILNNPAKIKSSKRKLSHLTPKKKRRK